MVDRRRDRDPPDDVPRADLRSPHRRRPRIGAVPGGASRKRWRIRPAAAAALSARSSMMSDTIRRHRHRRRSRRLSRGDPRRRRTSSKVACIDEWQNKDGSYAFGGTCLNAGCIPSKALLESSELYHRAQHEFAAHGIRIGERRVSTSPRMQKRRREIVKQSTHGIAGLFKARRHGPAGSRQAAADGNRVEFTADGRQEARLIEAKHVVLAAGSAPTELHVRCRSTAKQSSIPGARSNSTRVPKRLGVIGAGVIGLELGSVWRRLGSEVAMLEALDAFLPMADGAVAKEALKHFKKLGLDIRLGAKVTGAKRRQDGVTLQVQRRQGEQSVEVDKVVVAIGRRPVFEGSARRRTRACSSTSAASSTSITNAGRAASERLGRRRLRARPDARAQGQGRGRDGRRPDRRQDRGSELQGDPVGDLHGAGDRLGRATPKKK